MDFLSLLLLVRARYVQEVFAKKNIVKIEGESIEIYEFLNDK